MRNLKLTHELKYFGIPCLKDCKFISVDPDTNHIYGASDYSIFLLELRKDKTHEVLSSLSLEENGFPEENDRIVAIQYVVDQFALCVALYSGQILLWNHQNDQGIECVGDCNGGVRNMRWSPDSELNVLVTGINTVVLMTRDFVSIVEHPIHSSDFGEAHFVSVGWGKKETQFHGSEGKVAATKKQEEELVLLPWDDGKPHISWRGDGQYFAVSFVDESTGVRSFKIWSRDGNLHSTGQPTSGLSPYIAFKTQGNLMAGSVFHKKEHKIVFFEKNGLQHGEFCIEHLNDRSQIMEICWNLDSTALSVLCMVVDSSEPECGKKYQVQIWCTCNYHWYLKCCLEYHEKHKITSVVWDSEVPLRFHVVGSSGLWHTCNYVNAVQQSSDISPNNQTLVAVVDGAKVLMTPFRHMVVPPPMCAYQLHVPSFVYRLSFGHGDLLNDIIILCTDGHLYWFGRLPDAVPPPELPGSRVSVDAAGGSTYRTMCPLPAVINSVRLVQRNPSTPIDVNHMIWIKKDTLVACISGSDNKDDDDDDNNNKNNDNDKDITNSDDGKDDITDDNSICSIVVYHIDWEAKNAVVKVKTNISNHQSIICMDYNVAIDKLFVQLDDGACYSFNYTENKLEPWMNSNHHHISFPRPCYKASIVAYLNKCYLVGMTEQFRFFINDREIAQNCTSYAVHGHFLLLTTHAHTLQCILLSKLEDIDRPSGIKLEPDTSCRQLERGSRLVCVVATDTKVVLQMPRGNLEVIHPRWLLIDELKKLLDRRHYKEAFAICKKHRINMNILVDHNRQMFVDNIELFIRHLATVDNINLFLTDLSPEDFTKTMYANYYSTPAQEISSTSSARASSLSPLLPSSVSSTSYTLNKSDYISEELRYAILDVDCDRLFLSILMTHLKPSPPNLQKALINVKQLKEATDALKSRDPSTKPPPLFSTPAAMNTIGSILLEKSSIKTTTTECLKFLMRMVDVNELFNVALGTYDFQLVVMVAEMSHKDPKEYLPYLNDLKKLPKKMQEYTIDMKLKRYDDALRHISSFGAEHFDECMKLITEHNLYERAFICFKKDPPLYKKVAAAYGDHLKNKKCYEKSALMYYRAEMYSEALELFEKINSWRFALDCFYKMHDRKNNNNDNGGTSGGGDGDGKKRDEEYKLELVKLARRMAARLVEAHRFGEAATLMETYAGDYEETVNIYLDGHMWDHALALIDRQGRSDMIKLNLEPAMSKALRDQKDLMKRTKEDYVKYYGRLQVVRRMKREKMMTGDFIDADEQRGQNADLYSDTSSVGDAESVATSSSSVASTTLSKKSKNTGRSLKSKQKKDRKKWSLRQGGPTEEFALIELLYNLVASIHAWKYDVGRFLRILVMFERDDEAESLKCDMVNMIEMVDDSIEDIWSSFGGSSGGEQSNVKYGPQSSSNSISRSFNTGARDGNKNDDNISYTDPVLVRPPYFDKDASWKL